MIALGVILSLVLSSLTPLILINTAQAQLADSPWPMFGQNLQHTGRSPYTGPEIPELKWSFLTGSHVGSPAIGSDGTIYVGSSDHRLYAINPDGSEKWSLLTGRVIGSPAIDVDGTIYFGSGDGRLYAITPDGTEKWNFLTGGYYFSSPAIGTDGTVYFGSYDDKFYALNPDGTLKWSFNTTDVVSSPAIGTNGTIYFSSGDFSSGDSRLYAITPDGTEKWNFLAGGYARSPTIGDDGTIYVGGSGNLFAINPDGSEKWAFLTGGGVAAIGADGTIYVGSSDNRLYAINPDGTEKWNFLTGGGVGSLAIGADGTIYFGSGDSRLYAINPDGIEKWSFITGGDFISSLAIGADGTIYFGFEDPYELYAIGREASVLPPSSLCFIATAAYGTPMAGEIQILREFRDGYLSVNPLGQALVDFYYKVSPPIAEFITEHPSLKPIVRVGLLPAVAMSAIAVNTAPAEKVAIVGLLVLISVVVAVWATRRRGRGPEYN